METTTALSGPALARALKGRDARALTGFYAEDALVRIIDRNNPPSRPREIRGLTAIAAYWDDVCSREMSHDVETVLETGDRLAVAEACRYPDGTRVYCMATMELQDGRITRQTLLQAWDE